MTSPQKKSFLVIDSDYFLTREMIRALEMEGHQVTVIPFTLDTSVQVSDPKVYSSFLRDIIDASQAQKADALFTVNHIGFDVEGRLTEVLDALHIPALIWYVDSPRYIMLDNRSNVSDRVGIFLWDGAYVSWMKEIGFEKVHDLPLATDPDLFYQTVAKPNGKPLDDLIFVGDSMKYGVAKAFDKLPTKLRPAQLPSTDPAVRSFAEHFCVTLFQQKLQGPVTPWDTYQHLYRAIQSQLGGSVPVPGDKAVTADRFNLESALVLLTTQMQRMEWLKQLAALPDIGELTIYGDDGWKQIVNGTSRLKKPVDYYDELPRLYSSVGGILNLTSYQMPRGLNQRCFDVPVAGGFLLTDRQADIEELFEPDDEIVTFTDLNDMRDKWNFYRSHPEQRYKIILNGQKRILSDHTYTQRVREMIRLMDDWF